MITELPPLILASKSPRRQHLLASAGLTFAVLTIDVPEIVPEGMRPEDAAPYLSKLKAEPLSEQANDALVITADTVVILEGRLIGKPTDLADAERILQDLSGKPHTVITGVTLMHQGRTHTFEERTEVYFRVLDSETIAHYLKIQPPLDKAGAYGIQDYIGLVGVERVEGDFYNIMGLPVCRLMREMEFFLKDSVPEVQLLDHV